MFERESVRANHFWGSMVSADERITRNANTCKIDAIQGLCSEEKMGI